MEGLERILKEHPFFSGFPEDQISLVAGCARNHRFDAGQYLFREGDPADEFFLIRHGKVALEIAAPGQPPFIMSTLGEGEIVGASWLLPPLSWYAPSASMQPACVASARRTIIWAMR